MLSRAEFQSLRDHVHALALQIGARAAARAYNLKESRVTKWAQRYKWQLTLVRPHASRASLSPDVASPVQAMQNVLAVDADKTRLAMARTSRRAFEHADELSDGALHEMDRAIALEKHGRIASIAHQWNPNQQTVAVQVNVPLPDAKEREEMRSIDAKLDAIAAKLRA